ncbi:hypothetical protein OAM69_00885 [bacterium]|nr:hypothetical protein [bacterium]
MQLLVVPHSHVHRDEANLWSGYGGRDDEGLNEFIRKVSNGKKYKPHRAIVRTQMLKAFTSFAAGDASEYVIERAESIAKEIDDWDDYTRIELHRHENHSDLQRISKDILTENLLRDFDLWRESKSSFNEDFKEFIRQCVSDYWNTFISCFNKFQAGDYMAMIDGPVVPLTIKNLLDASIENYPAEDEYEKVSRFLISRHLEKTPYHHISCSIFAAVKDQVKKGSHTNTDKARAAFSGLYFDILHIAPHAPYCDAIFVDKAMAHLLNDRRVGLYATYNTKIFSMSNVNEFEIWLQDIESSVSSAMKSALTDAYPSLFNSD